MFFDICRVSWCYEQEGYDLNGVWYLPDFWLPDGKCFFEVKPFDPSPVEAAIASALAAQSGRMVFVAPGGPMRGIGVHAFSPRGGTQHDWCFVQAYCEDGAAYLAPNPWGPVSFKIRKTDAAKWSSDESVTCPDELERAKNYQFWRGE